MFHLRYLLILNYSLIFYILLHFYFCHLIYSKLLSSLLLLSYKTINLHVKGCPYFMNLKEQPHACRPANLSWLSDYVLGALACSDMELNCAAGIWWRGDCSVSLEPQSGCLILLCLHFTIPKLLWDVDCFLCMSSRFSR